MKQDFHNIIFSILLLVISLFFSCERHDEKYSISYPDKSGQIRFYHYTNQYKIDEDGCITFRSDSLKYHICDSYTIDKRY